MPFKKLSLFSGIRRHLDKLSAMSSKNYLLIFNLGCIKFDVLPLNMFKPVANYYCYY
jgi:hypothetical protein